MGWTFYNASGQQLRNTGTVLATQAEMEAASSIAAFVTPGRTHNHPGVAKGWCRMGTDGAIVGSTAYPDSYNVSATSTTGTGAYLVTWRDDFSQITYSVVATVAEAGDFNTATGPSAVGSVPIYSVTASSGVVINIRNAVVAFGDQ